jgi:hypothetical protein
MYEILWEWGPFRFPLQLCFSRDGKPLRWRSRIGLQLHASSVYIKLQNISLNLGKKEEETGMSIKRNGTGVVGAMVSSAPPLSDFRMVWK